MKWTNISTITLFILLVFSYSSSNSKVNNHLKQNKTNTSEDLFMTEYIEEERDLSLQKFFIITNITCNKTSCPGKNICSDKSTCECSHGLANIDPDASVFCGYEQKKQLYTFFLEVCFLGGLGHLYAGRIAHGVIKLILIIILPFVLFYSAYWSKWNPIVMIASTTICCGITIWHLVDVILIGMNKYMDGNGVPLLRW
jgi:hypothetical protein